jgi:iron complex outermembrane receptor protein
MPGLSVYGQVATATDTTGDIISNSPGALLLDHTTGRQIEAGVKQSLWGQRAEWTVAGYHIVKKKLLAPVPGSPGELQQIGQQSSRGVEATAAVNLPAGVRIEANVAALDARFDDFAEEIDGVLVSRVGKTPPSVPERSINVWLTWNAPQEWQFRGWGSIGRPTVLGQHEHHGHSELHRRRRWRAQTPARRGGGRSHLYNLTNELYATDFYFNGFAPQWMLGAPRAAEVALTFGF